MSNSGKFDDLTKQLITHLLGFKEDEENFIRSEQFVLSNLLYHHCLAVNSHAVRRSIDGLALKFTIHGQHQRASRLKDLTQKFVASPIFKDHHETDLEWSLLSLLLHLSNSPTQVPLGEGETQVPQVPLDEVRQEKLDWATYLREDDPDYVLGPEDPLSDWSDDEDHEDCGGKDLPGHQLYTHSSTLPSLPETLFTAKPPLPGLKTLEQLHHAKSWLSDKIHLQYWGPKQPQELPASNHPKANIAKLCKSGSGIQRQCQQLSEWAVMREVVWCLMCPVSSHVFVVNQRGQFNVKEGITLCSLTPAAFRSMLEYVCEPLKQLHVLDAFMRRNQSQRFEPLIPLTVLAYASGLWHWRQAFCHHLKGLEDAIKDQENTHTLLWLEGELFPWLRTLAVLFGVHMKAFALPPEASPRTVAMRLLGSLCEGVEEVGEAGVRGVMLRLLLHTLRSYLSIMHSWLMHGSLLDCAQEFIVHRDELITVYDERFWHKAFIVSLENDDLNQNRETRNPAMAIMKILSPLLAILMSVGKSQELLAALDAPPVALQSHLKGHTDCSLEEVVVRYIKDTVCSPTKESERELQEDSERGQEDSTEGKESVARNTSRHASLDPLMWAAFNETPQDSLVKETQLNMDHIASLIEEIGDIPTSVSVVFLLTSALQPLVRRRQEELSTKLTKVLLEEHHLAVHCQVVRSVLLMEAGDIMHEFYSYLFSMMDAGGEEIDSISLTLFLQYCVARLYPDLAQFFSVSVPLWRNTEEQASVGSQPSVGKSDRVLLIEEYERLGRGTQKIHDSKHLQNSASLKVSLTRAGIPELQICYQAPWPANLLLTEPVMKKFNKLFNFSLSLKRVTNGLERLKFKELSSWNLILDHELEESDTEGLQIPLQSRLHRLQLFRQWLLCFSRELHDHFANTAFLPFYQAVEQLILAAPPLNTIITEHEKLLNKISSECLMGRDEKIHPLQVALNKMFWLTQQLSHLWLGDVSRVNVGEITNLETHYAQVHRYLVNFLTTMVSRSFSPHLEGLTRSLVDTVPLLAHQ
ncbi:gamma-tubulin complex component 5-like [Portunus trituberculatus]|uniref:gamma-tubulin complex component 5-like n=1 Tax=Portunus trituberculatus TaxID=210409 RepID=UPI001E1CF890|nr:gamma-tubulin complex component 5-like [Portunus trituberculatus]XP_045119979.1 gamma-tubulin complex component 5-like [Portunus trituberculatus]